MPTNRIELKWLEFVAACFDLGDKTTQQQYIDMKRTFFGGVAGFLNILANADIESDEDLVADIRAELQTFLDDVKAGRQ
jgi:hypothetical protein